MCLIISLYDHSALKPLVAKIAGSDIHVYKLLTKDINNNYFTAFMQYPVVFSNGTAILEACLDKPKRALIAGKVHYTIKEGIHSFVERGYLSRINIYKKAIIPKGTRYYVGQNNDMVSEKLIIYE